MTPPEVAKVLEPNTPPVTERIAAMRRCSERGYPVRAVVMPIVPVPYWREIYRPFLGDLLKTVQISRLTLGSICSYPEAIRLMERKLGRDNPISMNIGNTCGKFGDGRARFPGTLREEVYKFLIETVRQIRPRLEISLCLETPAMFDNLQMQAALGRCNCVL